MANSPARKNLKNAVFTQDPSRASYIEQQDQTDLLEKIDGKLAKPLKVEIENQIKFPDNMGIQFHGVQTLTLKGDKGEPGLAGKDGKDGIDGKPGTNGLDGKPGESGPSGKDGHPGKDGKPGKDGEQGPPGLAGKDALPAKLTDLVTEVVQYIIKNKALDISQIKNAEPVIAAAGKVNSGAFMFNGTKYKIEELMHGAGSGGGGSFTILTATGTVDGSNLVFGFSTEPSLIISDGISLTRLDNNGVAQWSWNSGTMQATMNIPPINSIIGIQ